MFGSLHGRCRLSIDAGQCLNALIESSSCRDAEKIHTAFLSNYEPNGGVF